MTSHYRIERDSMGEVRVPEGALYGPQTLARGGKLPHQRDAFSAFLHRRTGVDQSRSCEGEWRSGASCPRAFAAAVEDAANQVMEGVYDSQFVVDIFQTGSGTSTNM